jgi:hypothetical protein
MPLISLLIAFEAGFAVARWGIGVRSINLLKIAAEAELALRALLARQGRRAAFGVVAGGARSI